MLELHELSVGYDGRAVVRDVSLTVGRGEILALLGSNGAGKSTLLNGVMGLLRRFGGRIVLDGHDVSTAPTQRLVRERLALVPERRELFATMSVEENLRLGTAALRLQRWVIEERIEAQLERFPPLRARYRYPASALSGGEQQMLALARALMLEPRVLLLDEPSLGLAPIVVAALFAQISALAAEGTAVILVEQNARTALEVAHRVCTLEVGRLTFRGTAHQALADGALLDAYLGGAANEMEQRIRRMTKADASAAPSLSEGSLS